MSKMYCIKKTSLNNLLRKNYGRRQLKKYKGQNMEVNIKYMAEDMSLGFCSIKGPKQEEVTDRKRQ